MSKELVESGFFKDLKSLCFRNLVLNKQTSRFTISKEVLSNLCWLFKSLLQIVLNHLNFMDLTLSLILQEKLGFWKSMEVQV